MKTSSLIWIFVFGMVFGYIVGLWHQAAQKHHRMTCPACCSEVSK